MLTSAAPSTHRTHPRPDLSRRLRYLASYYSAALPALLRPHRLTLDKAFEPYASQFVLTEAQQAKWFDLFGLSPDRGRSVPFTYITTSATLTFMYLLAELGVNFKHLRHVASTTTFEADRMATQAGHLFSYTVHLQDVRPAKSGRILIDVAATIYDDAGRPCAHHRETFMISGLAPKELEPLETHPRFNRELRPKPPAYERTLQGAELFTLSIPADMGVAYGKVSGDLNPVHTTRLAARLSGYKKPFVQGFCTVNLVLKVLAGLLGLRLERLSCAFVRPVFVAEDMRLYVARDATEGQFELVNPQGKVAAHGRFA